MSVDKIGAQHRARKAVLYVRQSSTHQVQHNRESQLLVTVVVKVAHLRLCHSRMMFVRAYPRESFGGPIWESLVSGSGPRKASSPLQW